MATLLIPKGTFKGHSLLLLINETFDTIANLAQGYDGQ